MNKHQKYLDEVIHELMDHNNTDYNVISGSPKIVALKELVDRVTPMKVIEKENIISAIVECANCGNDLNDGGKYCYECGQALDWSEDDD